MSNCGKSRTQMSFCSVRASGIHGDGENLVGKDWAVKYRPDISGPIYRIHPGEFTQFFPDHFKECLQRKKPGN